MPPTHPNHLGIVSDSFQCRVSPRTPSTSIGDEVCTFDPWGYDSIRVCPEISRVGPILS